MAENHPLQRLAAFLRAPPIPPPSGAQTHAPQGRADSPTITPAAREWLELLANRLGCDPQWLLTTGRITADDLSDPMPLVDAVRLIRAHGWQSPPAHGGPVTRLAGCPRCLHGSHYGVPGLPRLQAPRPQLLPCRG